MEVSHAALCRERRGGGEWNLEETQPKNDKTRMEPTERNPIGQLGVAISNMLLLFHSFGADAWPPPTSSEQPDGWATLNEQFALNTVAQAA